MAGDRRDSAVRRVLPIVVVAIGIWRVVFLLRPDGVEAVEDAVGTAGAGDAVPEVHERSHSATAVSYPSAIPLADRHLRPFAPYASADSLTCPLLWPECEASDASCMNVPLRHAPARLLEVLAAPHSPSGGRVVAGAGLSPLVEPAGTLADAADDLSLTDPAAREPSSASGIRDVRSGP